MRKSVPLLVHIAASLHPLLLSLPAPKGNEGNSTKQYNLSEDYITDTHSLQAVTALWMHTSFHKFAYIEPQTPLLQSC